MAQTEPIFKENSEKDRKSILRWFAKKHRYEYCFEDFSRLDFSDESLQDLNLRYSDFRNATLTNANFMYANLAGVRFCGAEMENAYLSYSILHETDFSSANLRNAKFYHSKAKFGLSNKKEWKRTGFFNVSFRKANLQNADFTGAALIGANFTEAIMDGAIFDLIGQNELDLSPEQMKAVVFK